MSQPVDGAPPADEVVKILEEKCGAGVFMLDLTSHEVRISPGLGTMIGFGPGRLALGLTDALAMIHPQDRTPVSGAPRVLELGVPFNRELRVITVHGHMRWMSVQCEFLLDVTGDPIKVVGVVTDTTLNRLDSTLALANRGRLRHLVSGVAPIVWAAAPDGRLTEMMGWETVTGMPDAKALGVDWLNGIHTDDRDPMLAQWQASIERKVLCDSEVRILQRDGQFRWFRVYGVPRFGDSGDTREWTGMAIDVHGQVQGRHPNRGKLVTGTQIRASRGMLRWSVEELCNASGVTAAVVRRLENNDGPSPHSKAAVDAITAALSEAGIEFTFDPGALPGVRPRRGRPPLLQSDRNGVGGAS